MERDAAARGGLRQITHKAWREREGVRVLRQRKMTQAADVVRWEHCRMQGERPNVQSSASRSGTSCIFVSLQAYYMGGFFQITKQCSQLYNKTQISWYLEIFAHH